MLRCSCEPVRDVEQVPKHNGQHRLKTVHSQLDTLRVTPMEPRAPQTPEIVFHNLLLTGWLGFVLVYFGFVF